MEKSEVTLHYTHRPSTAGSYYKLISGKRKGLKPGESLPKITATWTHARLDPENLKQYNQSCGLADTPHLPPLYPHVMAAPIHLGLVSHPKFPLKMMGSIHHSNHILQHKPIKVTDTLTIACAIDSKRNVDKGLEFDIRTDITANDEIVWQSITTALIRGKFGDKDASNPRTDLSQSEEATPTSSWQVPAGTGRRYAKITGDYNPIHLFPATAKLFGFKRDIAHGMWTLANATGKLDMPNGDRPFTIDAVFKGPMFMDSIAELRVRPMDTGRKYDVYCSGNSRPVICAELKHVDKGAVL